MSDEPSGGESRSASSLPPPPKVKSGGDEDVDKSKANARAVGVDTAFLDALGEEFADAPAPAGRYAKGGTLVVEGSPKTESSEPAAVAPKPAHTSERDAVVSREFLGEETPTLQMDAKDALDDGSLLFETAAASDDGARRLNLPSGRFEEVDDASPLPEVLAEFDASGASDPTADESDSDLVVSLPPPPPPEPEPEPEPETATDGDAEAEPDSQEAAPVVAVPAGQQPGEAKKTPPPVAAPPAATEEPDHRKYALLAAVALLLVIGGIALTRGGDAPRENTVAKKADKADAKADTEPPAQDAGESPASGGEAAAGGDGGTGGAAAADATGAGGAADGSAGDAAADTTGAVTEGEGSGSATGDGSSGGVEIEIDDDDDGGTPSLPAGSAAKKKDRAAEDEMSAKELREASRQAISQRRYTDGYRLAGKAQRKQPSEASQALRVEAACGMKNKDAAKRALDSINTGKKRRELRSRCRDLGTRVGL